jgi:3-phosphoshikimate 1-carboxyvinyltransferase
MIDYTLPLDQLPDPLPIEPLRQPFDVTITPPGSKSITCRAYVLAALAEGESKINRPLRADDTDHLLDALCTLGAQARWEGDDVYIKGVAGRFPRGGHLFMGEGGTPTRFMIACACLAREPVVIDASPRMRERPIAEGVDMLRQLGARIEYVEEEGRLPVRVTPSESFTGGDVRVAQTLSSQFISSLMLIAPWLKNGVQILFLEDATSDDYLHLTWSVMRDWDLPIEANIRSEEMKATWKKGSVARVGGMEHSNGQSPVGLEYEIEPDASSAVYWFAAAALFQGAKVTVAHLDRISPQPDQSLIGMFQSGGPIVHTRGSILDTRPFAAIVEDPRTTSVQGTGIWRAQHFHGEGCPDGSMLFAVLAAVADDKVCLTGLRTLRVKETDRIAALANELRKVGCTVETGEDWIEITPGDTHVACNFAKPRDGHPAASCRSAASDRTCLVIETYNDHRMAMAFAVLGLNPPNGVPLAIRNPTCVKKSYPDFWKDFARLYQ